MKNISILMMATFFAISTLSAESKQECTTKAMDLNQVERKECEKKKNNDEQKTCKKTSMDKLVAAKKTCADGEKKN